MHLLFICLLFVAKLFAVDTILCKECHPIIYAEFQKSMHKKSSIHFDEVHKSIWDIHPLKKKNDYKCAKCHTPESKSTEAGHEGISCISCHTITNIKKHSEVNKNIYETKPKTFYSAQKGRENEKVIYKKESHLFGLFNKTVGSPYHDLDYTNKIFYNGEVCMGCHSHNQNKNNFTICDIGVDVSKDEKNNCITCHMPKVAGTATTIRQSKTHAFHGFAGLINKAGMLTEYVEIDFKKSKEGFTLYILNKAPHDLLTQPLRVVQLKTKLKRDGESKSLKTHVFAKILGKDGKPAPPWMADSILKNNMIKANERRVIEFDQKLKSGDELDIVLGFYVVNPKSAKMLKLNISKHLTSFKPFKSRYIKVR